MHHSYDILSLLADNESKSVWELETFSADTHTIMVGAPCPFKRDGLCVENEILWQAREDIFVGFPFWMKK